MQILIILSLLCVAILASILPETIGTSVPDSPDYTRISGETHTDGSSTTYWLSKNSTTYYNALFNCFLNEWKLVSLKTESKQKAFVTKVVDQYPQLTKNIWTSGRRVNNTWTWEDGTLAQYQNFALAPEAEGGDCVAVLPSTKKYGTMWTTEDCLTEDNVFVCESNN